MATGTGDNVQQDVQFIMPGLYRGFVIPTAVKTVYQS